jgi:hypothetical protein
LFFFIISHTEDMNLFSINYLHAGSPKYWYSIAAEDAPRFESLATHHFNSAFRICPEFLRHKRYLLSPAMLKKAGIGYVTQVQRAGDAMITFPGAYHFGFNTGFNVAESTNFAVPEWVTAGEEAHICLCHPDSVQIDMRHFKELLLKYISYCRNPKHEKVSYSEWAKREAKKKNEVPQDAHLNAAPVEPAVTLSNFNKDAFLSSNRGDPLRYGDKFVIQLFPPFSADSTDKKKKSKKRKVGNNVSSYWFAVKKAQRNYAAGTRVLCYSGCVEKNVHGDMMAFKRWYAGTVTEVIDGQARVTFDGMTRRDDSWISFYSGDMFIHGDDASLDDIDKCIAKEIKRLKALAKSAAAASPAVTPKNGTQAPARASPGSAKKAIEITTKMLEAKKAAKEKKIAALEANKKASPLEPKEPKRKDVRPEGTKKKESPAPPMPAKPQPPKYIVKLVAPRLVPDTAFYFQSDPVWEGLLKDVSPYDLVMLQCLDLSGSTNDCAPASPSAENKTGNDNDSTVLVKGELMKLTIRCVHCATYFPVTSCDRLSATFKSIRESHFKINFSSLSTNTCCNYLPLREKRQMLKSWPKRDKGGQALTSEWCCQLLLQHGASQSDSSSERFLIASSEETGNAAKKENNEVN